MLKSLLSCLIPVFMGAAVILPGCAAAPAATQSVDKSEILTLDLKKGEVLQFALIRPRDGADAEAVRKKYFRTVFPVATDLGLKSRGGLVIKDVLIGDNKPLGLAFYSFPNAAAKQAFQTNPNMDSYKIMRAEGWEELHVYSMTLDADMQLKFDPSKDYTLAVAWTKPGSLPDYQRYLSGIESDFDEIGARYVARFNGIDLQSHSDDAPDPSQMTLVEWTDGPDLAGLQSTDAYKANSPYFQKSVTRFDFYALSAP